MAFTTSTGTTGIDKLQKRAVSMDTSAGVLVIFRNTLLNAYIYVSSQVNAFIELQILIFLQ